MTRHRFEPVRLLLGLALAAIGIAYAFDAAGAVHVPVWLLLFAVPAAFAAAVCTAAVTGAVRRGRRYLHEQRNGPGAYGPYGPSGG